MSKHTPGPWTWGTNYFGLSGSGKDNEVITYEPYDGMWLSYGKHQVANARLIAAAPELLEALETTLECLNENGFGKAYAQDLARAAITKVRGENNETV